jgi:hypothetical protein
MNTEEALLTLEVADSLSKNIVGYVLFESNEGRLIAAIEEGDEFPPLGCFAFARTRESVVFWLMQDSLLDRLEVAVHEYDSAEKEFETTPNETTQKQLFEAADRVIELSRELTSKNAEVAVIEEENEEI